MGDTRPVEGIDGESMRSQGKRGKTRRGNRKAKEISIYYNNVNGIRSKVDSFTDILGKLEPKIICVCETKIGTSKMIDKSLKEAGYKGITRCCRNGQGAPLSQ